MYWALYFMGMRLTWNTKLCDARPAWHINHIQYRHKHHMCYANTFHIFTISFSLLSCSLKNILFFYIIWKKGKGNDKTKIKLSKSTLTYIFIQLYSIADNLKYLSSLFQCNRSKEVFLWKHIFWTRNQFISIIDL